MRVLVGGVVWGSGSGEDGAGGLGLGWVADLFLRVGGGGRPWPGRAGQAGQTGRARWGEGRD
jgi:hypothetical protein